MDKLIKTETLLLIIRTMVLKENKALTVNNFSTKALIDLKFERIVKELTSFQNNVHIRKTIA